MSTLSMSPSLVPAQRRSPDAAPSVRGVPRTSVSAPAAPSVSRPSVSRPSVSRPSVSGPSTVLVSRRPARVRLTRRGRVVLMVAFLAVVLVAMTLFGGLAAATHGSGTPERVRVVQVAPGDTLYAIAGQVAEPGHVREMVQHIEELNSLSGSTLQVGQQLAIPRR